MTKINVLVCEESDVIGNCDIVLLDEEVVTNNNAKVLKRLAKYTLQFVFPNNYWMVEVENKRSFNNVIEYLRETDETKFAVPLFVGKMNGCDVYLARSLQRASLFMKNKTCMIKGEFEIAYKPQFDSSNPHKKCSYCDQPFTPERKN